MLQKENKFENFFLENKVISGVQVCNLRHFVPNTFRVLKELIYHEDRISRKLGTPH